MNISGRTSICDILPHDGDMCLLTNLLEVDQEKIICSSNTHLDEHNPLRLNGKLYAIAGIEYASQVVALHGQIERLNTNSRPIIGFLASARDVEVTTEFLDSEKADLIIEAIQIMRIEGAVSYNFSINSENKTIMTGRLTTKLMMEVPTK